MSSTARVQAMQKPYMARFWAQRRACGLELGITSPNRGYPGHPLGNVNYIIIYLMPLISTWLAEYLQSETYTREAARDELNKGPQVLGPVCLCAGLGPVCLSGNSSYQQRTHQLRVAHICRAAY